jgi:predicted xylose isomerase-like sugar epimerase
MTDKKPRINVTFDKTIASLLTEIAQEEDKSVASLVRELTLEALEIREDLELSRLAAKLDTGEVKTYSHEEAWK